MSRKRRDRIDEPATALVALEERYRGTPNELRARMMRLLKMEQGLTIAGAATLLGVSERTAHRWWRLYRQGGIDGLLQQEPGEPREREVPDDSIRELSRRLRAGEFQTLFEIQAWLSGATGVSYSIRSIADLVEDQLRPRRLLTFDADGGRGQIRESYPTPEGPTSIAEPMLVFFRSLPLSGDVTEWIDAFREALSLLLREADWITVSVNIDCNLQTLDPPVPRATMIDHAADPSEESRADSRPERVHADRLLEEVARDRFPLAEYHPPHSFIYYYSRDAYLGTIIIWRKASRPEVSERTLETMRGLESVVTYLLSGCVARYQSDRPVDSLFREALLRIVKEGGLSNQEKRILILQLLGHSYKEIADILGISIDTVGKHVNSIHRKTDTRSHTELLAKYFTTPPGDNI